MRVSILIFCVFSTLCGVLYGQAGNVGIGTISPDPSAKLDIVSDTSGLLIPRMTTAQLLAITNPASGLMAYNTDQQAFWYSVGGSWRLFGPDKDWAKVGNYTYNINDSIGIGTSAPSAKLDIIGDLEVNGIIESGLGNFSFDKLRLYPSPFYSLGFKDNQSYGYLDNTAVTFTMVDLPDYGWLWRDHNATNAEGAMSLTSDGRLTVKSTSHFEGSVGIGTDAPSAAFDVVGDAEFNGIISSGVTDPTYDKIRLFPTSSYTIGMNQPQTLGFLTGWATTFTMYPTATFGWLWRDEADDQSDGAMSLTTDGRLFVKNTSVFNGSVGIGDMTPDGKLEVRQTAASDILNLYDNNVNVFSVLDGGDMWAGSPTTFYVDSSTSRVGLGTSMPSGKLHIAAPSQSFIRMENTTHGFSSYWSNHPSTPWIGTITDDKFGIATNGFFRIVVDGDGYVGIGTASPDLELDVMGYAKVGPGSGGGGGHFDVIGSGGSPGNIVINQLDTDGALIRFRRDDINVGSITVSAGVVSYNAFTGSHYAWSREDLSPGMLVTMTGENRNLASTGSGEIIYGVRISSEPNDPKLLGVYMATEEPDHGEDPIALVMAVGNGEMWVTDAGEDIEIGDYLISSAVPGHGMKDAGQYDISYIIARAAEPVCWNEVEESIQHVKHKKISVLFESFTRNHAAERVSRELEKTTQELNERLLKLEALVAEMVVEQ